MLPLRPNVQAFGLHDNADITKDLAAAQLLLDTLILTGGASGGSGGAGVPEKHHARPNLLCGLLTVLQ